MVRLNELAEALNRIREAVRLLQSAHVPVCSGMEHVSLQAVRIQHLEAEVAGLRAQTQIALCAYLGAETNS